MRTHFRPAEAAGRRWLTALCHSGKSGASSSEPGFLQALDCCRYPVNSRNMAVVSKLAPRPKDPRLDALGPRVAPPKSAMFPYECRQ